MNVVIQEKTGVEKIKLTVAKQEVRIKFPRSFSEDLKKRLVLFSEKVANEIHKNFIGTMRGYFTMMNHGEYYILMQNNSRNKEKNRGFKEYGSKASHN